MATSPQKSPLVPKSPTPKSPPSRKKDDSFLGKLGGTLARRKKAKEGRCPRPLRARGLAFAKFLLESFLGRRHSPLSAFIGLLRRRFLGAFRSFAAAAMASLDLSRAPWTCVDFDDLYKMLVD